MSDNQKHEQRRFAIDGIKNTGFYYTKSLVDGKYKLPILYCLQLDGPTRYNELQRKMETATFRSLSKALKELDYMMKHPDKYKAYNSVEELFKKLDKNN